MRVSLSFLGVRGGVPLVGAFVGLIFFPKRLGNASRVKALGPGLASAPAAARRRCSLGLEEGFQVGLWRPEEGDLVGVAASCRGEPVTEEDHLLLVLSELLVVALPLPLD